MLRHLRVRACAVFLLVAFVGALLAAPPPKRSVAIPPSTDPAATQATSRPAWPPIPPETLTKMDQAELGPKFKPEFAARYLKAHELIEDYFETPSSAARKQLVQKLEATGLEPGVIGRLCRIRMYWPVLDGGGVYYVNEKTGVYPVRYFFGLPTNYDRSKPWPLVLKLPTANAFITDPAPTAEQVAEIYTKWMKEELAAHPDAVVVMPLLNLDELWGPSYAGMNAAMLPVQHVAGRVNVDPTRVYLVGHSMSAHAVWNLGLLYTTYFAAIDPLAGSAGESWQRVRIVNLRNVLPVVWHDADDPIIKVDASRGIVKALRIQKVDVEYEETKGIGHTPDAATAERAYTKTRARVRDLYPPTVSIQSNRPDTMFNRIDWVQMYQAIDPGKDHHAIFRHGSGTMIYFDNPMHIEATHKGNKFDVSPSNVDSFRLYLNDQMVDFSQAINVSINHRPRMEGVVKQSIDQMMKDQIFMGRGWRYFTAIIDVDMTPRIPPASRPASRPATAPATKPAKPPVSGAPRG